MRRMKKMFLSKNTLRHPIGEAKMLKRERGFDMESYRILAELSQAVMFEWDIAADRLFVSDRWRLNFGPEPQKAEFSKSLTEIFPVPSNEENLLQRYIEAVKYDKKVNCYEKLEMRLCTIHDECRWFQLRLLLRLTPAGEPERVFCMMTDINQQKEDYEKLLYQAQKDVLTGLYNKETTQLLMEHYLEHARISDKQQALLIIDIDGFKDINDRFGHLFGDAVIAELGHIIQDSFRESDIVGRFGGDEFMVLFKNIGDVEVIRHKAEDMNRVLQRTYRNEQGDLYQVSASIGIALSPQYGLHFAELFSKADQALYYVKEHGKNACSFYHDDLPMPEYVSNRSLELRKTRRRSKAFQENVIEYIFKILYHSQDANAAVNLILEIISIRYNISRTFILERNREGEYENTFEWCKKGIPSQQSSQQHIPEEDAEKFFQHFNEDGVFSVENTALLAPELKKYFADSPVKALLECAMYQQGSIEGVIGFEYNSHPRDWKSEEIEALSFTAEILSTFLLQKRSLDKMKVSYGQALEILDHIDSFIYVIDKNTYEILFSNRKAIEFFGTDQLGKPCYAVIGADDTVCPFCPMSFLPESFHSVKKDVYMPKRAIWLRTAVSRIHWTENREVCMLHCHDITAWKKEESLSAEKIPLSEREQQAGTVM
jgi:diguanylate cyclase (GGDEF)-like protein